MITSKINVFEEALKLAPDIYRWLAMIPKQKIYIAGPITGHKDYLKKFDLAEIYLIAAGHKTINPARLNLPYAETLSYWEIMDICYKYVHEADMVFFLDGWQKSRGARSEHSYACDLGKICVFEKKGV